MCPPAPKKDEDIAGVVSAFWSISPCVMDREVTKEPKLGPCDVGHMERAVSKGTSKV